MKLRIQDSSIRFRITLKELETLGSEGHVRRECRAPGDGFLGYAIRVDHRLSASKVRFEPCEVELVLCGEDFARLADPQQEGVYVQREWTDASGASQRFMAFVEKDRPATSCDKREEWIYDGHHGRAGVNVPIPGKSPK